MSPTDPNDDKQTQVDLWAGDKTDTVLEPATFDEDEVTENTDATFAPLGLMEGSSHDPTRYLVEGVLGVGGMGEVERVVDRLLGRRIARKRIKSEWIGRSSIQSRFEDEARITAQLDHPGIISVHDMGMDAEGRPWFTMKEVRGKTFTRVIAEHRRTLRGELHSGEVDGHCIERFKRFGSAVKPWGTPIIGRYCIAISSPTTSWSVISEKCGSWTGGWPRWSGSERAPIHARLRTSR